MKSIRTLILLSVVLGTYTFCRKNTDNGYSASALFGRWNVVTDSFPEGFAAANHIVVYTGKEGDTYDFRSDSNLYITENNQITIQPYHITSDSTFTLIESDEYSDSIPIVYYIHHLTDHTVTLADPWFYTPGGAMGRVVYLKR